MLGCVISETDVKLLELSFLLLYDRWTVDSSALYVLYLVINGVTDT